MFHLSKRTRIYDGEPYCGYTSDGVPAEYHTIEEARTARDKFQEFNPVGWNIYDAKTRELVEGYDYFA